ncbi:MAG: hypothetical protein ACWGPS_11125, partial [Candidatus Promineifilaceae bacterium]
MTATTQTRGSTLKERMATRKRAPATEKKDDTGLILRRLVGYMAGGDNRAQFAVAMVARLIAVVALVAIPSFFGRAIDVVSPPLGTNEELLRWSLLAVGAGVVFLAL